MTLYDIGTAVYHPVRATPYRPQPATGDDEVAAAVVRSGQAIPQRLDDLSNL